MTVAELKLTMKKLKEKNVFEEENECEE